MTYQEFRNKYNGKYIDYDGQYGNQCWDLGQQYLTECLKVPAYVLGGCGLVSNMLYQPKRKDLDTYFYEVPTNDMHSGDICIWEYGHIAIFDNWDGKNCWYFSQNPNPCKIMQINAGGLHCFRLKTKEEPNETHEEIIARLAKEVIEGKYGNGEDRKKALGDKYREVQNKVNEILAPKNEIFKIGDIVVPTKLVDYKGIQLIQYDKEYKIGNIFDNNATLFAERDGKYYIWAVLPFNNIKKVR